MSAVLSSEMISSHMQQYRKLIDSLLYEKPGIDLESKRKRATELAMKILKIGYPGDEEDKQFEEVITRQIKEICSLKVGRKLIKALAQVLQHPQIQGKDIHEYLPIRFDDYEYGDSTYSSQYKYVEISKNNLKSSLYLGCKESVTYVLKKPGFCTLAHELIHALHHFSASILFEKKDQNLLLKDMTEPEEQHTITGYYPDLFLMKGELLNKIDVICENAFLLASGLIARISHKAIEDLPLKEEAFEQDVREVTESYYTWLESELKQMCTK